MSEIHDFSRAVDGLVKEIYLGMIFLQLQVCLCNFSQVHLVYGENTLRCKKAHVVICCASFPCVYLTLVTISNVFCHLILGGSKACIFTVRNPKTAGHSFRSCSKCLCYCRSSKNEIGLLEFCRHTTQITRHATTMRDDPDNNCEGKPVA